ncbi:uncharacterized protein LOC129325785 [Eublepharis macularius]|uniref:Uncharacterized protein LOC129325785 n=1 Tax=Eublepharis macularius TaxID=481883 RepID=A0AA97J240_EUBMA|nr:uncharacterized protein LOC129325785 [Eublepharis macularius]
MAKEHQERSARPQFPQQLLGGMEAPQAARDTRASGRVQAIAADQPQSPPPRRVNGVLGGSAVLSVNIAPRAKVKEIEWSYRAGSGPALLVALFRDGRFDRPDPSDRFKQRIDMFNETLRIRALELNDSGIFGARLKIFPALVEDQLFHLTVYEPVLTPRIKSQLVSSTPSGCNVTLQCLSPGKGPVNVTWRKGNPIRDLGSADRYQVSPDGRTLQLSLQPTSLNTTYSCMASNPVEHKIVSFDLQRICQSGGTGGNPAQNPPRQVNGILGGSALFPLMVPSTQRVDRTEWFFQGGSSPEILTATFRDGKLERQNTRDRFGQRLEMAGETRLRIRALEQEDGGLFTARVLFATAEIHEQTFQLGVFGPVPDPQIRHRLVSRTADACNVTLQCLAPERGGINVSWRRGKQLRALEGASDWYRLSAADTDLHLSWLPDSSDSTFTCLLSNPAEQRNVSFDLLSICQSEDSHPQEVWILVPVTLLLILAAGLGICLWKKRPTRGAVPPIRPERRGTPEPHYAEVQKRRSPPEGNEDQDPDPAETPMVTTPVTVYAQLQRPLAT